jgi:hypothetical protein
MQKVLEGLVKKRGIQESYKKNGGCIRVTHPPVMVDNNLVSKITSGSSSDHS